MGSPKSIDINPTPVTVTNASATHLAANSDRLYLSIQNRGSEEINYRLDGGVVTSAFDGILPGGKEIWDVHSGVPAGAITMISASGGQAACISEGVTRS